MDGWKGGNGSGWNVECLKGEEADRAGRFDSFH